MKEFGNVLPKDKKFTMEEAALLAAGKFKFDEDDDDVP